jgi:gamma-glutamylputrescine oxidase
MREVAVKARERQARERPAYEPSWYTETMAVPPERPSLANEIDVEVCVVGGGLAGLTTARELARRGWSVVVLEARRVAWNASGRNTGFVLPGFAQDIDAIVRRVGIDHAKTLWDLSVQGVEYVRRTIRETGMPGVDPVESGWLKVAKTDDSERDLELVRLINDDLGTPVEAWPVDRVRAVLKSPHYFHGIHHPTAFHIHALNYALGLATAAEAAGARIFEDSPVVSIDTEGVRKFLVTPKGRVRASHIVLAGNVHLGALVPRIARTLMPVWTYVVTSAPLGDRLPEAIDFRGAVSDTDFADSHYRIVDGDRLMWTGGMTTWEANALRMVARLKAEIVHIFPQLAPVDVDHVWNGVLGNALHRMPQIGELTPRLWLASGFGGHGLNTTAMAGNIIARAIDEGDDSWRLFLPFELVWAGGRIGRAALQANYSWFRSRERAKAREARRRETEYERSQELAAIPPPEEDTTLPRPRPVVVRKPRPARARKPLPGLALLASAGRLLPFGKGKAVAAAAVVGVAATVPPEGAVADVPAGVVPDGIVPEGGVHGTGLAPEPGADPNAPGAPADDTTVDAGVRDADDSAAGERSIPPDTIAEDPFDAAWNGAAADETPPVEELAPVAAEHADTDAGREEKAIEPEETAAAPHDQAAARDDKKVLPPA